MKWTNLHTELNHYLADLIDDKKEIKRYIIKAGLPYSSIEQSDRVITFWFNILDFVSDLDRLDSLLKSITAPQEPFANDQLLKAAIVSLEKEEAPVEQPKVSETSWNIPDEGTKEKVIGKKSTLLPINFLDRGIKCSKAVVRIKTGKELGTGFLLENNWLLTNNHVIQTREIAAGSIIEFNYQYYNDDTGPVLKAERTARLQPGNDGEKYFFTSINEDFTLVKLEGDLCAEYGYLVLSDTETEKDEYVNIIQHPAGGAKQIALYNNMVTFKDANIVQYLTDTMPGSSGSPVFNSNWEVVALHNSGGWMKEPGMNNRVFRNAGINITRIKSFIQANNLV